MTNHNLNEHLSWLLRAKPSLPPTETDLPPAATSFSSVEGSQSIDAQINTQPREQPVVQQLPQTIAAITPAVTTAKANSATIDKPAMEPIRTAPGSATKPNLLPLVQPCVALSEPAHRRHASTALSSTSRQNSQLEGAPPTSPKQHFDFKDFSNDVEMMDLTEGMRIPESPSPVKVKAERKSKSDGLEDRVQASPLRVDIVTSTMPHPDETASQGSDGFNTLEDIEEQPPEPPPPYSTVPPRHGQYQRSRNLHRPGMSPVEEISESNMQSDQSDEASTNRIIDFCATTNKRSSQIDDMPPIKRRALLHGASDTTGSSLKRSISVLPQTPSAGGHAVVGHPAEKVPTTRPTPGTKSSDVLLDLPNEDRSLLQRFWAATEIAINQISLDLKVKEDSLCEAVAQAFDQEDDVNAANLMEDLQDVRGKAEMITSLSLERTERARLVEERQDALVKLKTAVQRGQGIQAAKAANSECRNRLQRLELNCLAMLKSCDASIINGLEQLTVPSQGHGLSEIAVCSTQAPARLDTRTLPVSSSSRIAQTQVTTFAPHERDMKSPGKLPTGINHHGIEDEIGFLDEQSPSMNYRGIDSGDRLYETLSKTRNTPPGFSSIQRPPQDEENIFSNRMGTPPPPVSRDDDDDFGMDDDDSLFQAADISNNGGQLELPTLNSQRGVFAQFPSNRQMQPPRSSGNRAKKLGGLRNSDDPDPTLFSHPWSDDLKIAMRETFRLRGFRQGQLEAMNATLAGQDTFILMPTGGGKSLCYQLPAMIHSGRTKGVTVVVSPLLSLMEDQVEHLRALDINAYLLNGESSTEDKAAVFSGFRGPTPGDTVTLLYVTPEMLSKNQRMLDAFEGLYNRQQLARLVIDEAHCVSQWGHDFRPDYKMLGDVRRRFPNVPVMALTATATENVRLDVIHNLAIRDAKVFQRSFNRPNLSYEVRQKGKTVQDLEDIANLIKQHYQKQTGIVYCLSRKDCETMAKALSEQYGIKAKHYHAGLKPEQRTSVQKAWQANRYHVMVATIAFGMGIDKPDVRFVVHQSLPKSLEGYYQETGRAGRDGKKSGCYLYYGYRDVSVLRKMIDKGDGSWEQKDRQNQMLRKMVQFCENRSDCRRVQVLAYFNEKFNRVECHEQCDNCRTQSSFEKQDFTEMAQHAVKLVKHIASDRITLLQAVDMFRGTKAKKEEYKDLPEYGAGGGLDRGDVERIFYKLVNEDVLREENTVNNRGFTNSYVVPGPSISLYKSGKRKFEMDVRVTPRPTKTAKTLAGGKNVTKAREDTELGTSKRRKKASGLRVPPAELPLSTNVSSPLQPNPKQKAAKQGARQDLRRNGFVRDKVAASDPEDQDYEEGTEDESEGFAPVRIADATRNPPARIFGPPIIGDNVMDKLDEMHREVVENFVVDAKRLGQRIAMERNLRNAPFSDTILRQMAIHFIETPEELLEIPNIDADKVQEYGRQYCKIVRNYKQSYEEIMQGNEEPLNDPNMNVIDLVSDDEEEEEDYGSVIGTSDFEEDPGEASQYFQPQSKRTNLREQYTYQSQAPTKNSNGKSTQRSKKYYAARAASGGGRNLNNKGRARLPSNTHGNSRKQGASGVKKNRGGRSTSTGGRRAMGTFSAMPT
ncbi:hypothetical protein K431DRAFT_288372 [Polychaeton citri CBS 116435]|uniref:RecQ-like DNA helicase BLM n=1 Tax=Polychaeton citri CBS 116435 TaxID=1314669 RepID=A0A9P4Q3A6_9PEZI|nr:hypothetical protein K431DRAFT_288372 [Polychaeton citri CBS 116435]